MRADLFAERTAANVATPSTSVPPAVASEEMEVASQVVTRRSLVRGGPAAIEAMVRSMWWWSSDCNGSEKEGASQVHQRLLWGDTHGRVGFHNRFRFHR